MIIGSAYAKGKLYRAWVDVYVIKRIAINSNDHQYLTMGENKGMKCEFCDREATMKLLFPFNFSFGGYRHHWGSYKYVCNEHNLAYDCNDERIVRAKIKGGGRWAK